MSKNQIPKGLVEKSVLKNAIKSLPEKIADLNQKKMLEKTVSINDAIKACFESNPELLDYAVADILTVLTDLGLDVTSTQINAVKKDFKSSGKTSQSVEGSEHAQENNNPLNGEGHADGHVS